MSGQVARHARRASATRRVLCWASIVLGVLAVVAMLAPASAQAMFRQTAVASVSVGTATVEDPWYVVLYPTTCQSVNHTITTQVNWSGVPDADSYRVTPYVNNVAQAPITVSRRDSDYTYTRTAGWGSARTYRFTVATVMGTWTGPATPSVNSVSC